MPPGYFRQGTDNKIAPDASDRRSVRDLTRYRVNPINEAVIGAAIGLRADLHTVVKKFEVPPDLTVLDTLENGIEGLSVDELHCVLRALGNVAELTRFLPNQGNDSRVDFLKGFLQGVILEKYNSAHQISQVRGMIWVNVKRLLKALGIPEDLNR